MTPDVEPKTTGRVRKTSAERPTVVGRAEAPAPSQTLSVETTTVPEMVAAPPLTALPSAPQKTGGAEFKSPSGAEAHKNATPAEPDSRNVAAPGTASQLNEADKAKEAALEAERKAALEAAKAALGDCLKAFEESLRKQDVTAANEVAVRAQADPALKDLVAETAALVRVSQVFAAAATARRLALDGLMDGKKRSFNTNKGSLTGVVCKLEGDALKVRVEGQINKQVIVYEKLVNLAELTPACLATLLGAKAAATPDEWLAESIQGIVEGGLEQAENAIAQAGAHPLAAHYAERLEALRAARREAEAQRFWEERVSPLLKAKALTSAEAQAGQALLESFRASHGATLFAESVARQIEALEKSLWQAQTPTYFVDGTRPDDKGDGTSWTRAKRTIAAAVALAKDGEIVNVVKGTYVITSEIIIEKGITLQSLVNGVLGGVDNAASTIIESSQGRVLKISHSTAKVDGFTIRNGNGNPGGGVLLYSGTVVNCVIRDNRSGGTGGGIAARTIAPKSIVNCLVLNNSADMGGGIGQGGTGGKDFAFLIRNCLIAENSAGGDNDYAGGGGVWVDQGSYAIIESCTIAGNSAKHATGGFGGGVRVRNCNGKLPPVHLINSIVYGNTATVGNNYYSINNQKATWLHSCTEPSFDGPDASMVFLDPLFAGDGNYSLQQTSPCIDTGKIQAWMMGARDLAGAERILKVRFAPNVDMGAYEASKDVKDKAPDRSRTAGQNHP